MQYASFNDFFHMPEWQQDSTAFAGKLARDVKAGAVDQIDQLIAHED